ncbi:MAG TPA: DegT/DnrJ/EryC1/StrS family aminotransferase [Solirubrobacteraceae bacterium]|jgi:dTDP-4-amino-4,6-dideoxygalactose transaminase|nr:DegT/DnrJ/EryC1/StrS family aminotransferase [Solirubrobacteraceae bacterium]
MAVTGTLALYGGSPAVDASKHAPWPQITDEDRAEVMAVLDRGVLCGVNAPALVGLEHDWAEYLGIAHCIATNSGTAALHTGIAALGISPGDEVVVPAHTYISTAVAVAHHGAVPVFCDIDERTFNIDPARIEERITNRTRAIMPVHLDGLPADMDEIQAIADRHGLAVIEDAAQAHGATYKGRPAGTLGDCAGFSLNATKNLIGGEGGLFVTDDPELFAVARRFSNRGEDVPKLGPGEFRVASYVSHGLGYNYRTQELPAALARSQLRRLPGYTANAQRNAAILTQGLSELSGLEPPYVPEDRTSVHYKYRVRIDAAGLGWTGPASELRDRLIRALRAEGVEALLWQIEPLPAYPAFRHAALGPWHPALDDAPLKPWEPGEFPVASQVLDSSIIVGSEPHPIIIQSQSLMEDYLEAFAKVMANLDAALAGPFEPLNFD